MSGFKVQGSRLRVSGPGFRVSGFRDLGCRAYGLWFTIYG